MKKVVTAIGSPGFNKKIKQIKNCDLKSCDITIDEQVIEYLEKENDIDFLFISSKVIKNYKIDEFIKIIRKLNENIFIVFFKYKNCEINIKEDDNLKIHDKLELDLQELDELLNKQTVKTEKKAKIIAITGANGVGKSTFSTFFAKNVESECEKTLLIDFDFWQNQSKILLKIKKTIEYNGEIEKLIVNVNKNLDVLCNLNCVFNEPNMVNFIKLQEMLQKFKNNYNLIIIDTPNNLQNEYIKRILYNSDEVIFLLEPNIIGVKKSQDLLEIFENDFKLNNNKIKIVLNKANIYQIADSIIEELFPGIKVIGKVKYHDTYNLMINKNIYKKEVKKEYEKIYKKISK